MLARGPAGGVFIMQLGKIGETHCGEGGAAWGESRRKGLQWAAESGHVGP